MYVQSRLRAAVCLAALVHLGGCGSPAPKIDAAGVESIRNVALVSFTVPSHVAEKAGSGSLSSLSAAMSFGRQLAGGKPRGNGEDVARDASAGFMAGLEKSGKLHFVSMDQVTSNAEFRKLKEAADQTGKGQGVSRSSAAGLPVIVLSKSAGPSEFAAQSARALGVDGVVMVDVNELHYFLYTGVAGSGQAKAKGSALFKLFDRSGQPVWEAPVVVYSEDSAGMVSGAINPAAAPALHRSIGSTMAADILKNAK